METPHTTTINVSLPSTLKEFVVAQIRTGGYGSASEYIRKLIREARERALAEKGQPASSNSRQANRG